MHAAKLRIATDDHGLVPVGSYFERLSLELRQANARAATQRTALDQEDRDLEALFRRRSASRTPASVAMTM